MLAFGRKVWQMNRSVKWLLTVTTTVDGFSLVNQGQFTKFAKLSTHQTSPLHSIYRLCNTYGVKPYR